jgi:hypothetical protein
MAAMVILDLNDRMRELVETVDEMDRFDLDSADQDSCVSSGWPAQRLCAPTSQ